MSAAERRLLVIAGPTASGKTALALELAGRHRLRLISADSQQVYRGMDLGTAKPGPAERGLFGLIDVADPGEGYSAGRFVREATPLCEAAWSEGRVPCLVGGTGLYLRALLQGMAEIPAVPPSLRAEVEAMEPGARLAELRRLDPETAGLIDPANPRRVGRALEVILATGTGLSSWQRGSKEGALKACKVLGLLLNPPPEELKRRIRERTAAALKAGWAAEAKALAGRHGREALLSTGAIGYAELLDGPESEAAALISQRTARYARRQRTWFRKEAYLSESADLESFLQG